MPVSPKFCLPVAAVFASLAPAMHAQTAAQTSISSSSAASPNPAPTDFIGKFLARVTAIQNEQPHWVTPLVTVTPRLEQELRTDFLIQPQSPAGPTEWNYGGTKGLEIIPFRPVELIFNVPPYLQHNSRTAKDGFGDVNFLLKYRLFARNEEHGNGILTIFLQGTLPTGSYSNGAKNATVIPTVAGGKGFGKFDVQSTVGATLPVRNGNGAGRPIAWNTTVQFHQDAHWWPEIENNYTYFKGGDNATKTQNFILPGIVTRWKLHNRVGVTLGAGIQIATSGFHEYNHGVVTSARIPF